MACGLGHLRPYPLPLARNEFGRASEYAKRAVRLDPASAMAQDVLKKVLSLDKGFG